MCNILIWVQAICFVSHVAVDNEDAELHKTMRPALYTFFSQKFLRRFFLSQELLPNSTSYFIYTTYFFYITYIIYINFIMRTFAKNG